MTPPAPELSVVVPVFNEVDNLDPLVAELVTVLDPLGRSYEIVLVDDGSRDGSGERIGELSRRHAGVRGLHFRENRGQTAAFDAGFRAARGDLVITIDADLQNDPADIPKLLDAVRGHDAAVGYRTRRNDRWLRRVSSTIANAIRNAISGDDIVDTGCSLKVFRRASLAPLKLYTGLHRFLPTLVRYEGGSVVQVPVNHRPRLRGASKYGVRNRAFRAFVDLLAVRWMRSRRLGYEVVRHDP